MKQDIRQLIREAEQAHEAFALLLAAMADANRDGDVAGHRGLFVPVMEAMDRVHAWNLTGLTAPVCATRWGKTSLKELADRVGGLALTALLTTRAVDSSPAMTESHLRYTAIWEHAYALTDSSSAFQKEDQS